MSTTPPQLSFDRADLPSAPPPTDACSFCQRGLTGDYYRVNSRLACSACATQAQGLTPVDTHAAYSRAVLFGLVAAVVGCAAYATFGIVTGITLGWIAIGVGYAVGWAMKKGSNGLGGRRYQITAAILTYAAVAVAAVPMTLHDQPSVTSAPTGFVAYAIYLALLLGVGLVSPFLLLAASFAQGAINLFIICIGIRFAWRFTAGTRINVEGPFS